MLEEFCFYLAADVFDSKSKADRAKAAVNSPGVGDMWAYLAAGPAASALSGMNSFRFEQSEGNMEKYGTTKQCPKCGEGRYLRKFEVHGFMVVEVSESTTDRFSKKVYCWSSAWPS